MKRLDIHSLLSWAFGQELCKVGAGGSQGISSVLSSSWALAETMDVLGTLIDRTPNMFGVIPGFLDEEAPHPDALAIGAAVRGLAAVRLVIPDGWQPFADMDDPHGLIAAEVAAVADHMRAKPAARVGRHMVAMLTSAAILGRGPDWHAEQPGFRMVSAYGKPLWFVRRSFTDSLGRVYEMEQDGYDAAKQKPKRGAYRRYELSRPIRAEVLSRLDWQVWQACLLRVSRQIEHTMTEHEVGEFVPDMLPWMRSFSEVELHQVIDIIE